MSHLPARQENHTVTRGQGGGRFPRSRILRGLAREVKVTAAPGAPPPSEPRGRILCSSACFCTDRAARRHRDRQNRGQDSQPEPRPHPAAANRVQGGSRIGAPHLGPSVRPPTPTRGQGQGHSRHSFSSLLSKQSGSPSHCQAPGMQRPLPHMKLPGMLHSLVKLFPGSSWLSVGERGQGVRGHSSRSNKGLSLIPLTRHR